METNQEKLRLIETICAKCILTNLLNELDPFLTHAPKKSIKKYLKEFLLKLEKWNVGDTVDDIFNSLKVMTQRDAVSAPNDSIADRMNYDQLQARMAAMTNQLKYMKSILNATDTNTLDEIEDTKNICSAEEKLLANWEEAQLAQTEAINAESIEMIKNEISQLEQEANVEDLAAINLTDFHQIKIKKFDELIEKWQKKHDSDLVDMKIQENKLQMDYERFNDTRAQFEMDFIERQRIIDEFEMGDDHKNCSI